MNSEKNLKSTSLRQEHLNLNAKMVDFAGWEMPIQYEGILAETKSVRSIAGAFDVSHMGRVKITGKGSEIFLSNITSFDPKAMSDGQAKYGLICNEGGGIIDDIILYRKTQMDYLLIPNASNTTEVLNWIHKFKHKEDLAIEDITERTTMISIQGPLSQEALNNLIAPETIDLKRFRSTNSQYQGYDIFIGRTGYTGENGFEIVSENIIGPSIWKQLLQLGVKPVGLGARDILRLEAGLPLHGNEISKDINPYQANLERFVNLGRDDYIANVSLGKIIEKEIAISLIGFKVFDRIIPRHHNKILNLSNKEIGYVTSGSYSPHLDMSIGMGYVQTNESAIANKVNLQIRNKIVKAEIIKLPFYKRS
jgi:aminomethyltransferase